MAANSDLPDPLWGGLIEELASRVADQLALQLAKVVSRAMVPGRGSDGGGDQYTKRPTDLP